MNVFDFDNTLYKGESSFDFALFMIKKKKRLILYLPRFVFLLFLYKICVLKPANFKKRLEKLMSVFLKNKEFTLSCIHEFWLYHIDKLDTNMLKLIKSNDVISTASPSFLIDDLKDVLNTDHIICTQIDLEKGKISVLNFHDNKVKTFKQYYPNTKIQTFYTDSYNDKPLMDIAQSVYLVKKGKLKKMK